MYIVINKTTGMNTIHSGNFPLIYLESLLNNGDSVIVISTYSNTIKVPILDNICNEWEWIDYDLPTKELGL